MHNLINNAGITVVNDIADANVAVINSCCFIEDAIAECESYLQSAAELKAHGKLDKIYLSGCYPQYLKGQTLEKYPYLDGFITPDQLTAVVDMLNQSVSSAQFNLPTYISQQVIAPTNRQPFAYVKIAEGCNHSCRFCIIPQLRGRHRSRNPEVIVNEINALVQQHNKREIILISQDTTFYGRDLPNKNQNIVSLLQQIADLDGDFRVRLMYLYPTRVNAELISFIAANQPRFYPYFDLPIQHIARNVLSKMGRGDNAENLHQLPAMIRKAIPNAALRCTLLVGFPGETENDFENLCEFVESASFDRLGVFPYSNLAGVASFNDNEQVDKTEAQDRADRIMLLQADISEARSREMIGKQLEVLIDKRYKSNSIVNNWPAELIEIGINPEEIYLPLGSYLYICRSYREAPEIDGVITVVSRQRIEIGQFKICKINKSTIHDLSGSFT